MGMTRTTHHNQIQCRVLKVTVEPEHDRVVIDIPKLEAPDMNGAIALARRHYRGVKLVDVFSGNEPDTRYRLESGQWRAWKLEWR